MSIIAKTRDWYGRFERPISSISLITGFIFNAFTLKRVDMFWENFWILGHIVIVGVFILLIQIQENEAGSEGNPKKIHFWYVNVLQFFFGGLLSTYLVFYFRSTDIFVTWPFILILVLAFIANESMKRHYMRFGFQIGLFFLSIYSFAIFLLPVILHKIGDQIFLLSGFASLFIIFSFILLLFFLIKDKRLFNKKTFIYIILVVYSLINILYFTNLIPPIPLSLKDGGVYHNVERNQNGGYNISKEVYQWKDYFKLYNDYKQTPGSPVFAFSAIFSPENLDIIIIHEWQYYENQENQWQTMSTIRLPVVGGREGGFRTFSKLSNLKEGKWRVNIETEFGQTISRLRFKVISADTEPLLVSDIQ